MTSSLDLIRGRQVVQTLTNQSGGGVIAGDVVIIDTANDESFTTTTTAAYNATQVCISLDTIAANATGRILLQGYAPLVNVSASATRGYYLLTHTVAKQATSGAAFATGAFGQVLKAGTTPSAYIFPPAIGSSAGITRSGSTTGNNLAVWNGSNADSLKDGGAAPTAYMVKLAESVLVGAAGDITFSAISGAYRHLKVYLMGRTDVGSTAVNVYMQFNGDTGSNYDTQELRASASGSTAAESLGAAQLVPGNLEGTSSSANYPGAMEIIIYNYSQTTFTKLATSMNADVRNTSSGGFVVASKAMHWRNTAAITSIKLAPSSSNFIAGTTATLYGLV